MYRVSVNTCLDARDVVTVLITGRITPPVISPSGLVYRVGLKPQFEVVTQSHELASNLSVSLQVAYLVVSEVVRFTRIDCSRRVGETPTLNSEVACVMLFRPGDVKGLGKAALLHGKHRYSGR